MVESTPAEQDTGSCRFLKLPGELRNRIYRLALIEDDIQVTKDGFPRSSLLLTNKQIRSETFKIFYYENTFRVEMLDWNSDVLLFFTESIRRQGIIPTKMHIGGSSISPKPNWKNLLLWLQRNHAGAVTRRPSAPKTVFEKHGTIFREDMAISGLSEQTHRLRDLTWKRVQDLLQAQRLILVHVDERWGDD